QPFSLFLFLLDVIDLFNLLDYVEIYGSPVNNYIIYGGNNSYHYLLNMHHNNLFLITLDSIFSIHTHNQMMMFYAHNNLGMKLFFIGHPTQELLTENYNIVSVLFYLYHFNNCFSRESCHGLFSQNVMGVIIIGLYYSVKKEIVANYTDFQLSMDDFIFLATHSYGENEDGHEQYIYLSFSWILEH
ncbi:hypothetical protein ACJX0J_032819, partial [Zea mays]